MSSSSASTSTSSSQQSDGYGNAWAFFQNVFVGLLVNLVMILKVYYLAKSKGKGMKDTVKTLLKDVLDTSLNEQTMKKISLKKNNSAAASLDHEDQTKSPKKIKLNELVLEDQQPQQNQEDNKN